MELERLKVIIDGDASGAIGALARSHAESESFVGFAGKALGVAIPVAIGAAGIAAVKMAGNFQELMTQLVTGAGESESNIKAVRDGIIALAPATATSQEALAKGMYMIESAGYHGAAGLAVLKSAAEGAKVGGAQMATVADALTSALNAYGLKATDANKVTNTLVATVANGKMHMEDLAGSLGKVLPAAAKSNVSLQEIGAAMAVMTAQGTPAADAATYLRQTLLNLQNPSGKAKKAMQEIGLTAKDVAETLTHKGLHAALELVTEHLHTKFPKGGYEATATLANMVGGVKSMQASLLLTGTGAATFATNMKAISGSVSDAHGKVVGFDKAQEDLNFKLEAAKLKVTGFAIQVGTALIPYVEKGLDAIGKLASWLHGVLAPVFTQVMGTIREALQAASAFWNTHKTAIMAAGTQILAIVSTTFGQVRDLLNHVATVVVPIVVKSFNALSAFWKSDGPAITSAVVKLKDGIVTALNAVVSVVGFVADHWNTFKYIFLAGVAIMIPYWIKLGVEATIAGAKQVAAWVMAETAAIRAGISFAITVATTVAGWIAMGVEGIASGVKQAAGWVMAQGAAIAGAASLVTSVAIVIGSYTMMGVRAVASGVLMVGSALVTAATVVASYLAMAAAALVAAAAMIAPFLPFIALAALVAFALYELWKHWDQVWGWISNAAVNAWNAVTGAFSGAVKWMEDLGGNLISGLIHGITSMNGAVWDAIKSLAKNFIIEPFKHLFGINSPSTVFYGWGGDNIQGLVNGTVDHARRLLPATMQDVADLASLHADSDGSILGRISTPSGRSALATPTVAGLAGSRTVSVSHGGHTFNLYGVTDPHGVADEIKKVLDERDRQTEADLRRRGL